MVGGGGGKNKAGGEACMWRTYDQSACINSTTELYSWEITPKNFAECLYFTLLFNAGPNFLKIHGRTQ